MDRWRGRLLGARVLVVVLLRVLVVPLGEGAVDNGPLLDASRLEKFVDELPEMPRLRGFRMADGGRLVAGELAVGIFDTTWKFHRDMPPTRVFAYGTSKEAATVPGPTIEAVQGVPTYVTWTNHLPAHHFLPWDHTITTASPGAGVPTVVHLHGGVQAPSSDGSSLAWFTSNFTTTGPHFRHAASPAYMYSNFQPPGNLWYHDHAMGLTRVNILAGLLGAYRVSSPAEHSFNLPLGAEFDRQLVLLDRAFRSDGSIFINRTGNYPSAHPQWRPEYFGTANIVNGKAWPYLSVRRRLYRFRILNASNARFFRLSFSNGLHFVHVASDSVYLEKPVKTKKFLVAPSEIVDVVVDFSESTTDSAILLNDARFPYPSGDPTDETNGQVMKFVIIRRREHDPSSIPRKLMELPRAEVHEASRTRYITMYEYTEGDDEPVHLYLNARSYLDPVTETPKEGTTEIWNVINLTDDNHPLHVHLAVFAVLEQRSLKRVDEFKECMQGGEGGKEGRNNVHACRLDQHLVGRRHVVPRQERGWKNVFKVRPSMVTKMLVRFKPLSTSSSSEEERFPFNVTAEPGYVYHCHILDHEDNEMMRPMKLVH